MKIYMAPMEGITGHIFRNAYKECFDDMDTYYTPFISPHQNKDLSKKELQDVLPENNEGIRLVPQILSKNSDDFIRFAGILRSMGYQEINLNLGCPSPTVVTKGKGSGFLAHTEELRVFLDEIFEKTDASISIKTRLGMNDASEFEQILSIYNQFPLKELIIHPRIQKDIYKNKPNMEMYAYAEQNAAAALCYNGDIFSAADYQHLMTLMPQTRAIMLGRGMLYHPYLAGEIKGERKMGKLSEFHRLIYEGYRKHSPDERGVLFRMKELWSYLIVSFPDSEKQAKKIKKATNFGTYEAAVAELLRENR